MSLLEFERLVRKITEVLQQAGNLATASKLAEDFVAACHAANLRLQQCEAMIKAGDRHQAIQLAETAPNLLDLVTVLEFSGSDQWRGYCQQNGLAVAERIDGRSVQTLNECYAQGITTDHPLYAAYRRGVLGRNDDQALKALQSIARLNPSDANGAAELTRLDGKVLAARLQHLGDGLAGNDPVSVVAEIEAIEAFGFKCRPEGEVWRRAQTIRCAFLIEEAAKLKSAGNWIEALAKLDFVRHLKEEFKLELTPSSLEQMQTVDAWAKSEQTKDQRERAFQSNLAELRHRIAQSEEKDTSSRYVELPELRSDYEGLNKIWRGLTDFARPIPEEAGASFRKRSDLLQGEIARRTAIRRRLVFAGSFASLAIIGMIAWLVLNHLKARDFAAQLQSAINQRQTHATEALLDRLDKEDSHLAGAAKVSAAAAAAETFLTKERTLFTNFQTAFNALPQKIPAEPDAGEVARVAGELSVVQSALGSLAPDLNTENAPRVQAFEKQWRAFITSSTAAVNSRYEQWVANAENQCSQIDYRLPVEKSLTQVSSLSNSVREMSDCEAGFSNYLSIRAGLLQRASVVRTKYLAFNDELTKLDAGMDGIRKARALAPYLAGITLAASSEFSASPMAVAASAVQGLNPNEESILRTMLNATNPSVWACIQNENLKDFIPAVAMPAEQKIISELLHDSAISPFHQKSRLWLDAGGTTTVDWITVGAFEGTTGWKQIKAVIPSPDSMNALFTDQKYGFFDGKYMLGPTRPVYKIEWLGNLDETSSFYSLGLDRGLLAGGSYSKSLLDILDSLKESNQGSPVFRGYLFQRLVELMKMQPEAWGLSFCPAIAKDDLLMRNLVGGSLNSGDWFVASKKDRFGEKLAQLFGSVKDVSYAKQAHGLLMLDRAAAKDGLRYIGFVGIDGKPSFLDKTPDGEVWGYNAEGTQVVLLASRADADHPLRQKTMPLSPLFAFASQSREYLARAGVSPADPSFAGVLPPLFQEAQKK